MDESTRIELQKILDNPQTGQVYNKQQLFSQVHNVFAIDSLREEILGLRKDLKDSNTKSAELERSNYRLQLAIFVLTAVAVALAVFEFISKYAKDPLQRLFERLFQGVPVSTFELLFVLISNLTAVALGIIAFKAQNKLINKQIRDTIKLHDELQISVKNFQGERK